MGDVGDSSFFVFFINLRGGMSIQFGFGTRIRGISAEASW